MYLVHISLVELLKKGIVAMNEKNVYHADIKDSNVLIDDKNDNKNDDKIDDKNDNKNDDKSEVKTRLIDWGLSTQYVPFKNNPFPKTWRNRPFQFNVPFSVIIFSDSFIEKYTKFIKDGGKPGESELKPFVIDYINFWMKERGAGHYKYINEIMFMLFANSLTTIPEKDKPRVIETKYTMEFIVDYIVDVLLHYTKFKSDGTIDIRQYLDNVFIEIVDIWGFIVTYIPLVELLSNSYNTLTKLELKIFNQLQFIFVEYLYNPRHEPVDMDTLFSNLTILGELLRIKFTGKKRLISSPTINTKKRKAKGFNKKTRKNNLVSEKKTRVSFRRGPPKRRFKNPYFLSLK
jgi:serine/threonine protein kinase